MIYYRPISRYLFYDLTEIFTQNPNPEPKVLKDTAALMKEQGYNSAYIGAGKPFKSLKSLEFLQYFPDLIGLRLSVTSLPRIDDINLLTNIEYLALYTYNGKISDFGFVKNMKNLKHFGTTFPETQFISELSQLETLEGNINVAPIDFSQLNKLKFIEPNLSYGDKSNLTNAKSIRGVQMDFDKKETSLDFLSGMESLEAIALNWVPRVTHFPDMHNTQKLKWVLLLTVNRLTDFKGLAAAKNLEELDVLTNSKHLKAAYFEPLLDVPALKHITVSMVGKEEKILREMFGDKVKDVMVTQQYFID